MADINLGVGGANSAVAGGYDIANSLKLEPDNTEYLSRTIGSTSNRKTFTVSCWFKRTELKSGAADANGHNLFFSGVDSTNMVSMQFHTWQDTNADKLEFRVVGSTNNYTSRRFRDTSAWYHIVLAVDTTQATESNRWKLYVNGVQETAFDATSYPSQNADTVNNVQNNVMRIGTKPYAGNEFGYFAGYIADYYHIDGEALAPTEFGEFDEDSGIWKPKAYTGSFGTNGWYLDFVDAANLGDDSSGNSNNFTLNNITAADQATDTPTNNFATGNPLVPLKANTILTEGATNFKNVGSAGWASFAPSIAVQSGKWYVEFTAAGATTFCGVGNVNNFLNSIYYGNWNTSIGFYGTAGLLFIDGATQTWSGLAYGSGDIVGIALDKDNGYVYMSRNGTWANSGDPTSGSSGTGGVALTQGNSDYLASDYFYIGASQDIDNGILQANYGGYTTDTPSSAETDANGYGTFEYAPPTGYYALCTKNLAEYG